MGRKETRDRVNPYNYYLIIRLIELEAIGLNPTNSSLIYLHLKNVIRRKYSELTVAVGKSPSINSILKNLKQNFFMDIPDIKISHEILSRAVQCLTYLENVDNWTAFEKKHSMDKGAIEAEKYKNQQFSLIDADVQYNIKTWASSKAIEMYNAYHQTKNIDPDCYVYENSSDHIVRTATLSEVLEIEILGNQLSIVDKLQNKVEIFLKNPYCFNVYTDGFGKIIGYISILPLTTDASVRIHNSTFDFYKMGASDIDDPNSKSNGLMIINLTSVYIFPLASCIKKILDKVHYNNKSRKLICFNDSNENDHLCSNFGWKLLDFLTAHHLEKPSGNSYIMRIMEIPSSMLVHVLDPQY